MLIRLFILLPHLLKIFVDGGYKQGVIDWAKAMFGFLLEVVKRPNLPRFVVLPKRWIVERIFAWISRCRRNSKDHERTTETSETMIYITMIGLMSRRLARQNTL